MPHRFHVSFLALLATLFLLPLFFVPGGALDLASAKAALMSVGILAALTLFLIEFFRKREVTLPKHHVLTVALLLPVVYLLSALLTTPSSLSLFGYSLEAGTFGSILLGTSLLILVSAVLSDVTRALELILALFASLGLLALFATAKILSGGSLLVLGNFVGNMGNPLGSWMDLGIACGLLSTLSMAALGMLPMKGISKALLCGTFVLSTALLAIIHFTPAFILTLIASIFFLSYFRRVESGFHFEGEGSMLKPILLPVILGLISLVFLVNPALPGTGNTLGSALSGAFGVSNTDVHPTFATTLSISKAVLSQRSLFGSGPNTFTHDWLIYKPTDVNATPFWSLAFPFGSSFIFTQVALTGIIGSIAWLTFFILLLWLAVKTVSHVPESRALRFATISTASISLFLYTPSVSVLLIAFIFTGALLALGRISGLLSAYAGRFKDPPLRHLSTILIVLALGGVVALGWFELTRTLGAFHFDRAVSLSNTVSAPVASIESEIEIALRFAPLDTYYLALSQLNFAKAQSIATSATGTPEGNRAIFEDSLGKSITAARSAVDVNPASYSNWISLGNIYSTLVPDPLKIEGAYESAQFAFNEAYKRNPANPELPLLLAQLEINKRNIDEARSFIRSSLALKPDYPDAYVLLARLEVSAKNVPAAIASAEKVAALLPDNVGVQFELGLLKYSNGDYLGAASSFQKALTLSPEYANAKFYLGLSLGKLGRTEEARQILEELRVANPDNAELKTAIESLTPVSKKK